MSLRSANKSRASERTKCSPEKGKKKQKYSPSSSPPRNQFRRSPRAIPPPPATPKEVNASQPTRAAAPNESKVTTPRQRKKFGGVGEKSRVVVNATVTLGSNGVGKQHSPTPQKQIKRKSPQRNSESSIGTSVGTPTHRTRPSFQPSEKPNLPMANGNRFAQSPFSKTQMKALAEQKMLLPAYVHDVVLTETPRSSRAGGYQ